MVAVLARRSDRVGIAALAAIAGVSAAIYAALTRAMSLDEFFPGPGVTLDFQVMLGDDRVANTWWLYGAFAVLFALWGGALWVASWVTLSRWSVAVVVLGGVAMAAALVPMYPPFAVDFFHYLGEGRLLWVEGENPMVRGPGEFFPIGMSYGNEPAAYGPLWYWTLGPPVLLGGDDFPRSLLLLKGWMVGWLALTAFLGVLITRGLAARASASASSATGSGRELLVAIAIAWNPYALWRVAGNGHNDIVMMAFALLAVWLVIGERWRWVLPALLASVLVKYVSLLLVPVFAIYLLRRPREELRRRLPDLAVGGGVALVLLVAAFAAMWEGLSTFDQVREQSDRVITSTPDLVSMAMHGWFGASLERADEIGLRAGAVAFGLAALVILWRQRAGAEALVAAAAAMLLAYALLGVGWFRPWYFLWVITLAPLLPGRWWMALAIATSVAGLAPDVAEKYAVFAGALRPLTEVHPSLPAILLQFLPPAIVWLAALQATRSASLGVAQLPVKTSEVSMPARSAT